MSRKTGGDVRWLLLDIRGDEADLLDAIAKKDDRTRAYIARKAIAEYLKERTGYKSQEDAEEETLRETTYTNATV